jgi:UDP-glucuronate 4-epimerase
MKILVTGASGFIGHSLSKNLIKRGHEVIGIDNINDYYDVELKYKRLNDLGISKKQAVPFYNKTCNGLFTFIRIGLEDRDNLIEIFKEYKFDAVCNLAAQAGVRYSIEKPFTYVESNLVGFVNLLENCRNFNIKHLVYASSSSVYGLNDKIPFSTEDRVEKPISLYAATKKSNELMAHTYSHLFGFATTGLRFFTVYGPWGRPDMAAILFADAMVKNNPINVFNYGEMERDFTFIEDIVEGIIRVLEKDITIRLNSKEFYKIYNIGNNKSEKLLDFINEIESNLGITAKKNLMEIQPGDVSKTWADVSDLIKDYNYQPKTSIKDGVKLFIDWYKKYYNI